jgi:predicted phage terminase large subunit-like protein
VTDGFSIVDYDRWRCAQRGGFAYFARRTMHMLARMPKEPRWTWVQQEYANHCEALWRNELPFNTLIQNAAPGGGKSSIFSELFPAWIYSQMPGALIMGAGYDDGLQIRACDNMIRVMRNPWYVERWGDLVGAAQAGREFYTTKGGYRFSTSVEGGGTGRHCDLYLVDDPVKAITARRNEDKDAKEARQLAIASEFVQSSIVSRGRDENFRFGLNMQRLHEGDPTGFVRRAIPEATVLRLPYWFEPALRCVTPCGGDRRTQRDEELDARLRRKVELDCRLNGGRHSALIQAQYQQHPTPPGGRVFHENTFLGFDSNAEGWRLQDTISVVSLDCAFKGGSDSDFVGLEVWGYAGGRFCCFYSEATRLTFTETLARLAQIRALFPTLTILIEDKANGSAVIDVLRHVARTTGLGAQVVEVDPKAGKIARARAAAAYFAAGKVFFDMRAPWWEAKKSNMLRFPVGADDDTDAMTQAILWLASEYAGGEGMDLAVGPDWQAEQRALDEIVQDPRDLFRMLYGGG